MTVPRLPGIYAGLIKAEVQATSAYRLNILVSAVGWVIPFVMLALWRGAAQDGAIEGVTAEQFTTYFCMVLITTSLELSGWLTYGFSPLVHEGRLAHYLVRPYHPLHNLIAQAMAEALFRMPTVILMFAVVMAAAGAAVTAGWAIPAAFAVWLAGAAGAAYVGAIGGAIALWVTKSYGLQSIVLGAAGLLGGLYAPIALLPGVLEVVARHTPFWFAVGAPSELVAGIIDTGAGLRALAEAIVWVIGLHLAFRSIWTRGVRQYELVGG
jgi:ABC-2 type transport system permease protein